MQFDKSNILLAFVDSKLLEQIILSSDVSHPYTPDSFERALTLLRRFAAISPAELNKRPKGLRTITDKQLTELSKKLKSLQGLLGSEAFNPTYEVLTVAGRHYLTSDRRTNNTARSNKNRPKNRSFNNDYISEAISPDYSDENDVVRPLALKRIEEDTQLILAIIDHLSGIQKKYDRMSAAERWKLFFGDPDSEIQTHNRGGSEAYRQTTLRGLIPYLGKSDASSFDVQIVFAISRIYEALFTKNFGVSTRDIKATQAKFTGPSIKFASALIDHLGFEKEFGSGVTRINKIGNAWKSIRRKSRKT